MGMIFRTIRFLMFHRWGPFALVAALVVVASVYQPSPYSDAREETLRLLGLGFVPIVVWLALFLGVLRLRPSWLWKFRHWWAGAALLVPAVLGALAYSEGISGVDTPETLGGTVGQEVLGTSDFLGALRLLGLLLLAAVVFRPRFSYRATIVSLRRGAMMLRKAARGSYKGIRWLLDALGSLLALVRRRRTEAAGPEDASSDGASLPGSEDEWPEMEELSAVLDKDVVPTVVEPAEEEPLVPEKASAHREPAKEAVPSPVRAWRLPSLGLFELGPQPKAAAEKNVEVARRIAEALGHHGVEVRVDQIKPGPTVTLYGLTPGWVRRQRNVRERDQQGNIMLDEQGKPVTGQEEKQTRVKVDSILAREKDLALALAAPSLRIQAPVPGESVVGIEVPNREPLLVTVRSVMEAEAFQEIPSKKGLPLALGQGSGGEAVVADLRQLPHLLIAGATGSGKSVCINSIIVSLVSNTLPEHLRLLLIDPKRVELTPYNGLPHLVTPVVVETDQVVPALRGVMREMLRRYRRFEELGARNIEAYYRHPQALEPMPYLVIAIDELADLMMAAPYDIEQVLCRLAQLGRATGIHLVVATQRPSVDVITGLIKANFPSRISFAVVSQVDSRTILDAGGAEKLLGKGDMLFLSGDSPKPRRVQGAFVSDREIGRLMEHWRGQQGPPLPTFYLEPEPEETSNDGYSDEGRGGPRDELLEKAKELGTRYTHLSTSLLQRRLRIGYPRAARLMDQLEDEGIIAPGEPGKSREVLTTKAQRSPQPE